MHLVKQSTSIFSVYILHIYILLTKTGKEIRYRTKERKKPLVIPIERKLKYYKT